MCADNDLRQRTISKRQMKEKKSVIVSERSTETETTRLKPLGPSFWLTRVIFLRCLGLIYSVAFFVAYNQNKELIGDKGLLPLKKYLSQLNENFKPDQRTFLEKFQRIPTLFWLLEPWSNVDGALDTCAILGLTLSFAIFVTGSSNSIALTTLWILYHSLVHVGQQWYGFGWESQLLETGFLAIWIVPIFTWKKFPADHPPPWIGFVFYRWMIMKIMLGAGLIKIRGDQCWIDFTCMNYFFETQPNPNPVAYFAHHAPEWLHKFETFGNHVVELVFPLLTLIPLRSAAMLNGFFQILFQLILISTGNLSFLNWLTILPSLWYFDDRFLSKFFCSSTTMKIQRIEDSNARTKNLSKMKCRLYRGWHIVIAVLISYLSFPIVTNLLSSRQVMNTSYEPFRIVNTYGAFGSVTRNRTEIIVEGTWSDDPRDPNAVWMEYEFHCKPGDLDRRPCIISPYHYRLDWLMWFAAFQRYEMNPWLIHLAGKMLQNEIKILDTLLSSNPFRAGPPPKWVRASHYSYKFTKPLSTEASRGQWWSREYLGIYMIPLNLASIDSLYSYFGWQNELEAF